jgi:hypothetical protein
MRVILLQIEFDFYSFLLLFNICFLIWIIVEAGNYFKNRKAEERHSSEIEGKITEILIKYVQRESLSAAENAVLEEWQSRSAEHYALPDQLRDPCWRETHRQEIESAPSAKLWEQIEEYIRKRSDREYSAWGDQPILSILVKTASNQHLGRKERRLFDEWRSQSILNEELAKKVSNPVWVAQQRQELKMFPAEEMWEHLREYLENSGNRISEPHTRNTNNNSRLGSRVLVMVVLLLLYSAKGRTQSMFNFRNEPLQEVLKEFAQNYKVTICNPKNLKGVPITGKISKRETIQMNCLQIAMTENRYQTYLFYQKGTIYVSDKPLYKPFIPDPKLWPCH